MMNSRTSKLSRHDSTRLIAGWLVAMWLSGFPGVAFCQSGNERATRQDQAIGKPAAEPPKIEVWYGDEQTFGQLGHAQRWINVLGHVSPTAKIRRLTYRLNDSREEKLTFAGGPTRIARTGDFNVEIARDRLKPGINTLTILARDLNGIRALRTVEINYLDDERRWPLPYSIDWSEASSIQDVVQVVDGKWELTPNGVRSVERHYDRVIAFGDETWTDYEVSTTVTVHAVTPPRIGANTTGVTHAAIATRWPGHDQDGKQPSIKWHPLGATAEFRLGSDLSKCRWRIFDGKREFHVESKRRRRIEFEQPYAMKHRVETLADGRSRYRVKLWSVDEAEPTEWDLERLEPDDLGGGSALLIAHHADVTFGDVTVISLVDGLAVPTAVKDLDSPGPQESDSPSKAVPHD